MTDNIQIFTLKNGAQLLVEEIPTVRSAAAGIFIQVGSRNETPDVSGASHFVEHMIFKGTSRHSAKELAELFEDLGGHTNAYTSKEYTCVYAKTLDEDIQQALELMFEMVFDSAFAESEFETEKKVVLEEINMYEDTPDELVHDVFSQNLYGAFAMGHPILGTLQSVTDISRDTLYQYYKQHYTTDNIIISIAGNVKADLIAQQIESMMPEEQHPHRPFGMIQTGDYQNFMTCIPKQLEQVHICLGVPGISCHDDRRHALTLMNSILGGGMSSRLFQSLREQRGLAYSVYSFTSCSQNSGAAGIYIGTGQDKIPEFFAAFQKEIEYFLEKGVTDEELQRSKKMAKSGLYMGLESINNRMSRLARSMMMYGETYTPEKIAEWIYAVQKEEIQKLARELFGQNPLSMCAIGSPTILPQVQEEFERWYRKA